MISIFAVPRIDRDVIWGIAENIARRDPSLPFSECIFRAAAGYEGRATQDSPTTEERLIEAVRNRPHTLMKDHYDKA